MALRKGLQRVHRVMLVVTGLIAVGGIITGLTSAGDEGWFLAVLGVVPLVVYGIIAWIAAGFFAKEATEIGEPASAISSAATGEAVPVFAGRWPRFWARMSDLWIETTLLGALVGYAMTPEMHSAVFGSPGADQWFGLVILPFAMILNAGIVAVFGNSIGKAVAGIRVGDIRAEAVPFSVLVHRNAGVWWYGLAAGFPLISLFTLWKSSAQLLDNKLVRWDLNNGTRCYAVKSSRVRTWATAGLAIVVMLAVALYSTWAADPMRAVASAVEEVNRTTPQMVDEVTRLERAEVGGEGELVYVYTLTNVSFETHDLELVRAEIDGTFREGIVQNACSAGDFRTMIDGGIPAVFRYYGGDGSYLGAIRVDRSVCRSVGP